MIIKINKITNSNVWYKNCLNKEFKVQSESRKGGKGKYIVRLNREDRHLMNGYIYGWVKKEDCKIVDADNTEV